MREAEVLLLTLEVEAAAARNADLSHRIDELQSLLLSTSSQAPCAGEELQSTDSPAARNVERQLRPNTDSIRRPSEALLRTPPLQEAKNTEPVAHSNASRKALDDDVLPALINLDDALFEIAEAMALLYPEDSHGCGERETLSARHRRLVSGQMTLAALTHDFLCQVKRLRAACEARLETFEGRVRGLASELEHSRDQALQQAAAFASERAQLERRICEQEVAMGSCDPAKLLSPEQQDVLARCKEANQALQLENVTLRRSLAKLQLDLSLKP